MSEEISGNVITCTDERGSVPTSGRLLGASPIPRPEPPRAVSESALPEIECTVVGSLVQCPMGMQNNRIDGDVQKSLAWLDRQWPCEGQHVHIADLAAVCSARATGWRDHGDGIGKRVVTVTVAEAHFCDHRCTVGAPCRRAKCGNAVNADSEERRINAMAPPQGYCKRCEYELPRPRPYSLGSDPVAARLDAPGVCVMRGRR